MRKLLSTLLILLLTLACGLAGAEIYKWRDADGKLHFGDRPPAEARTESVELRINTYESPEVVQQDNSPAGDSDKQTGAPKKVVMYSAEWCGVCKKAKAYFRANNIPFTEYDIDKSAKGKAGFRKLNGTGVPLILVGRQRMNGFSPGHFEQLYRSGS